MEAGHGGIAMVKGLAVVECTQNDAGGPETIARCPTGAIVWVEGVQFQRPAPAPASERKEAMV